MSYQNFPRVPNRLPMGWLIEPSFLKKVKDALYSTLCQGTTTSTWSRSKKSLIALEKVWPAQPPCAVSALRKIAEECEYPACALSFAEIAKMARDGLTTQPPSVARFNKGDTVLWNGTLPCKIISRDVVRVKFQDGAESDVYVSDLSPCSTATKSGDAP